MTAPRRPAGFSLLEVIAAVIIVATLAAISIPNLRTSGSTAHGRSCDLTREVLHNDVQRYLESTGNLPSADLRELRTTTYSGPVLPTCPASGAALRIDRSGNVVCPTHP